MSDPNAFEGLKADLAPLLDAWADRGVSVRAAWVALCVCGLILAEKEGMTIEQALKILEQSAASARSDA